MKETAPAAAVGAAGGAKKQQQKQKGGAGGKQQQQRQQREEEDWEQGKARGADSVSWDAAANEELGAQEGGEVQQEEDNLQSNSQVSPTYPDSTGLSMALHMFWYSMLP